jgi:S1-C subfamily serine protease
MTRVACRRLFLGAWIAIACLVSGDARAVPADHLTVVEAGSARLLGSATAIGGRTVLTNRHVIELARRRGAELALSRSGRIIGARIAALSDRLDLAVLVSAEPLGAAPPLAPAPASGATVSARGPAGRWVEGVVIPYAWREAWGPAIFARLPVGFGFSGGPVRDAAGALVGLVTAAVNPSASEMLVLRAGRGGLQARDMPVVLVLPIAAVLAEAERLIGRDP